MGLKLTNYFKFIGAFICVIFYTKGVAQVCTINKFNVYPDSANQKKKDTSICNRAYLDLYGSIPALKQTTSYVVNAIPFLNTLPCEGNGTVPSNFIQPSNEHSPVLNIGFNFCFYGNYYSKCVVADNGYISFDTTLAGLPSKSDLSTYPPIPNSNSVDYLNTIMGCCMDLALSQNPNDSITFQTVGTAPYRVFIVKYIHCGFEGAACSFPANELDMKIALYETTNLIEVYIKKKTMCSSWNGGKAIQGIQDEYGQFGTAVSGRNNTQWTAANDAVRFTPDGANNPYIVKWYQNATYLGTGVKFTINPQTSAWYRAELSIDPYCGQTQTVTVSDSVYVNVKGSSSIVNVTSVSDTIKCDSSFMVLDGGDSGIAYRWNTGDRSRYLLTKRTGVYYCHKVRDTSNCYFDSVRYDLYSQKVFIDSTSMYGCFPAGLGSIRVFGSGGSGTLEYKIGNKSYGTGAVFDSIGYGSYNVRIRDGSGCEFDTLLHVPRPTINIILGNTCGLDSTGAIAIHVKDFGGGYTIKLDTAPYKTDTFYSNVKGGTHNIKVKNASGCVYDTTINAPFTSLKLSITYSTVKASGCTGGTPDGSITVNASGGNPPYRYSINYGTYKSSGVFPGLNEGSYFIRIRDTFNCGIDTNIQVQALAHLYVNAYVVNASCFGSTNASIVINGFGGVAPYSFSFGGGGYSSVNTRNFLGAGTMTVSIRDGRGCQVDSVVPIGQPPPLKFAPVVTHVSCYGGNNGQIIIPGMGGVPPYMFAFNGGGFSTNNTFSNLAAGTYTARIRDINLCTKDTNITVTQPFPLNFLITKTNTSCYNSSDGKVVFTGFGGTAPYYYSFNGSGFTTRTTYDTLAKGTYTVTIRDAKNCSRDSVVVIGSPQKLSPMVILKNVSCFGGTNGTIKVIASGGTPPCTYSFNNNAFTAVDSFTNVGAGTYSISIKDSKGCLFDTFTIVTEPLRLWFNVNIRHVGCFGDSSGQITLNATGGSLPYKYAIGTDSFTSNNLFIKKVAGTYALHIRDFNGCIYDTNVTIAEPVALKVAVEITDVTCYGTTNGQLKTSGSGGAPPFQYRLNGGAYTASLVHPNLAAGPYTVTVRDSNNCTFDTLVFVRQPVRITSQLFITNTNCYLGNDGSFRIRSSGGVPPYSYALDTAAFGSDSVFANLTAGAYKVYTRDALNCIVDTIVNVLQPPKIVTNAVVKNITCYNGNDGRIQLAVGGGTGPYLCSTDSINFGSVFVFDNLIAGVYKFYIKDSRQCTYDTTVTVFQSTFMINGLIVKDVSCFNSNDGSVRVVTTGGSKPYKYSFNGGAFDTISVFNNLPIGTYNVQTKDTFNCIKDTTVTISQPPQIFVKATSVNVQCYNAANGTIEVSATGGIPPFTYALDNNVFTVTTKYYGLAPGTYKVYAKDNMGCVRDTTITITQPDSLTFYSWVKDVTCFGGDDGTIRFSASGATPPYLYAFEQGNFVTDTVVTNLRAGTYSVRIRDANNCLWLKKVTVTEPPKPLLLPPEIVRVTWYNDSTVLMQWKRYPKALRYNIESKYLVNTIITDTFFYQNLPQQEVYEYRLTVTDSCNFLSQISLMHNTLLLKGNIKESKYISLSWNPYKNWVNGVAYYNIYKFDIPANSYTVVASVTDTFYNTLVQPEDTLSEYIYYVEAVEQDGNNATSVSNKVFLYTEPVIWMPNAFTPNNDGINDLLLPKGVGVKEYTLTIYDRWGTLLFTSDDIHRSWDGTYEGTELPLGTYIYELKATCYLNRIIEKQFFLKGAVHLVR